ncbi:diguanylate cyclase (GGDEF) domain-containing protein [Amphritea atlantica]|uniref:diguanylate cyclase n=1 Tax=Amphritea atlantica TaxID=355243 RepID=A0A1H9KYU8_9GAMM|nr:diguanylate cyclase [Amphritea atlantica]SER04340.1 diguanylate cyclase (GGDEF) domain-containing protein [Amphritea atlantica]
MHVIDGVKQLFQSANYNRSTQTDYHRLQVILFIAPIAALVHILLIPFFYFTGVELLAGLNCISVLLWVYGIRLSKQYRIDLAIQIFCCEVLLHSVVVSYYLGPDPGFQYYLWSMSALAVMDTSSSRIRVFITAILLVLVFALLNVGLFEPLFEFPFSEYLLYMKLVNMLVSGMLSILAIMIMRGFHLNQQAELRKLADIDSLTGLYNRRQGGVLLEQAYLQALRKKQQITVVMADIDRFKQINDRYGHAVGDIVLCQIADALKATIRKSDALIRWGGEEFLILLSDASAGDAETLLEKVYPRLEQLYADDEILDSPVTLSFGIAQWSADEPIEQTIMRADNALYVSKQEGRNRITLADGMGCDNPFVNLVQSGK